MALATITLIGLYNYDHNLFENLTVPEAIDKPTLIDNILLKSGEFESLYSSLPFVKNAIGIWSAKWYPTFEKWAETMAKEYDPIENYDRNEEWEDTNTGTQTTTNTGTQTTTNTGTETTTNTGTETTTNTGTQTSVGTGSESTTKSGSIKEQQGGGNTNTNEVSAYDSATYTPHDKQTFSTTQSNETTYNQAKDTHELNSLQNQRTDDLTQERTDDLTHERTDDLTQERTDDLSQERTDDLTAHHEGRVHGNIGVTTSQQMLESEMILRLKWNLIEQITDLFLQEFVIPVY